MPEELILAYGSTSQPSPTLRDVLMVFFRHRRLIAWSFLVVFAAVVAFSFVVPRYEASMRVLVRRGRLDPPITPQASTQADFTRLPIAEEEINSEVELLRDDEILRRVAPRTSWLSLASWLPCSFAPSMTERNWSAPSAVSPKASSWSPSARHRSSSFAIALPNQRKLRQS
jgi:hypothetical protein